MIELHKQELTYWEENIRKQSKGNNEKEKKEITNFDELSKLK
jgi:hypothetical protein